VRPNSKVSDCERCLPICRPNSAFPVYVAAAHISRLVDMMCTAISNSLGVDIVVVRNSLHRR
jgi:hypothetical protein